VPSISSSCLGIVEIDGIVEIESIDLLTHIKIEFIMATLSNQERTPNPPPPALQSATSNTHPLIATTAAEALDLFKP
jgi:hypothetical protein